MNIPSSASIALRRASGFLPLVTVVVAVALGFAAPSPAAVAHAHRPAGPRSLTITCTFEGPDTSMALPVPWTRGGNARAALVGLDDVAHTGRRSVRLRMPDSAGFCAAVCRIPDSLREGRVAARLSGWVRTSGAGSAGLWMRAVGLKGALAGRDLSERGKGGTSGWTREEILLPLPPETRSLTFGLVLRGGGSAWADDFKLELLVPAAAPPPGPLAHAYIQAAIDSLRRHLLSRRPVDWADVRGRAKLLAMGASKPSGTWEALGAIADRMDQPTRLLTPEDVAHEDTLSLAAPAIAGAWPHFDFINGWCGYIQLPGLPGDDRKALDLYADQIQHMIARFDSVGACGYIVDLRTTNGLHPDAMLAGLGPLLGTSTPGGELNADSSRVAWLCADGAFARNVRGRRVVGARSTEVARARHDETPIAVLLGPGTLGAGEAVATAFRGRPETHLMGKPTAGLARGVKRVRLRDGAVLEIASSRYVDRNGRISDGPVLPDEPDTSGVQRPGYREPIVETAIQWIREQAGCLRH